MTNPDQKTAEQHLAETEALVRAAIAASESPYQWEWLNSIVKSLILLGATENDGVAFRYKETLIYVWSGVIAVSYKEFCLDVKFSYRGESGAVAGDRGADSA